MKMMDARIRNAPFAIVVSCSPYTCAEPSRPCYPTTSIACPRLPALHDVQTLAGMLRNTTAEHMSHPAKSLASFDRYIVEVAMDATDAILYLLQSCIYA